MRHRRKVIQKKSHIIKLRGRQLNGNVVKTRVTVTNFVAQVLRFMSAYDVITCEVYRIVGAKYQHTDTFTYVCENGLTWVNLLTSTSVNVGNEQIDIWQDCQLVK
jgi:hypothetical protein